MTLVREQQRGMNVEFNAKLTTGRGRSCGNCIRDTVLADRRDHCAVSPPQYSWKIGVFRSSGDTVLSRAKDSEITLSASPTYQR